jgi:hypothetical protein
MGIAHDQKKKFQWLRWILVLPAAIVGAVIAISFSSVLHPLLRYFPLARLSNQPSIARVLPLALVPVAFVLAGLKTAPKQNFFVGSCLALTGGLLNFYLWFISVRSVYGHHSLQAYKSEYTIGILGGIFAIYIMRWTKEKKIKNKTLIWLSIGYILFAIMVA